MDNHLLLNVEDEAVQKTLGLLEQAGFKADIEWREIQPEETAAGRGSSSFTGPFHFLFS